MQSYLFIPFQHCLSICQQVYEPVYRQIFKAKLTRTALMGAKAEN